MAEEVKIIEFHVMDDFEFRIGKTSKKITVPRMKFKTGGTVIAKIAEVQASDIKGAIELLFKTKNGDVSAAGDIQGAVAKLIQEKNFGLITELLGMISEGVITADIIEQCECQYDEVIQILVYLIEKNFSSLKNLSASLKAITSSGQ